jgi:ABC-type amino acid transport substrate-binding protein
MILKIALLFCLFFNAPAYSVDCSEIQAKKILTDYQWYTEDYPPYNYRNKLGKLVGIYPEIIKLIYKELDIIINLDAILTVPWARLVHTIENSQSYAGFNMIKTPDRDKIFQLVSLPIMTKISIMVLEENENILADKQIENLAYSVVRQDIGEQLLDKQLNRKNKVITTAADSMLGMLLYRRVEAIAYSELVASFQLTKFGYENKKLVSIYTLSDKFKTAFVFHKDTPTCVSVLFSQAITTLDEKGEIEKVVQKYQH